MTIEDAINEIVSSGYGQVQCHEETMRMAVDALRAQQERENPKPLTVDELRQMDGKPVWFVDLDDLFGEWRVIESIWPNEASSEFEWRAEDTTRSEDYSKTWLAYRYPPKEAQK